MKSFLKSLVLSLLFLSLINSNNVFAGDESGGGKYSFNGRTYRLDKFRLPNKTTSIEAAMFNLWDLFKRKSVPAKVDLTPIQTMVKDQNERGSCTYFAANALMESAIKSKKAGLNVNLSEEYLIWYTKGVLHQSSNSEGAQVYPNLIAMGNGLMLEKDMPYQPSSFSKGMPCEKYSAEDYSSPAECFTPFIPTDQMLEKKISLKDLNVNFIKTSSAEVVKALASNTAVAVSLPLNTNGWDAKTGDCIFNEELQKECFQDPSLCGGHAILLTGYDKDTKKFTFKNSWNKDWGNGGYGTLPFEYIDKYAYDAIKASLKDVEGLPASMEIPSPQVDSAFTPKIQVTGEGDAKQIDVTMTGGVTYMPNTVLYISNFVVYLKDGEPAGSTPTDDNVELLKVPEAQQETYGMYVKGYFHDYFRDGTVLSYSDSTPAVLTSIPESIIDKEFLKGKETYLRVSVYVHNDTGGWEKLFREYFPADLQ